MRWRLIARPGGRTNILARSYVFYPPARRTLIQVGEVHDALEDCHFWAGNRPILRSRPHKRAFRTGYGHDQTEQREIAQNEDWDSYGMCAARLKEAGLLIGIKYYPAPKTGPTRRDTITDQFPEDPRPSNPLDFRQVCKRAYVTRWTNYMDEVEARKLCAKVQDPRYPPIYHSLEQQAHMLYLLGRVELERDVMWRPFAWYMLAISAGLGQLDAALLLHQLAKHDPKFSTQPEQVALIAEAAERKLDWRAITARSEHIITATKRKVGQRLPQAELDQCMELLTEAMKMTHPTKDHLFKLWGVGAGHVDVDALEEFEPPYKLLLRLTADEISAGNTSEDVQRLFETAAVHGARYYNDHEAAWQYVHWCLATDKPYTAEWVQCAELATTIGNADACFQLARYHLKKDGWYLPVAQEVLDEVKQQMQDNAKIYKTAEEFRANMVTEQDEHDQILKRKNPDLLRLQDGMVWMKIAAQLMIDDPSEMLNRYSIMSGLYRQNGFLEEGRMVLQEAREWLLRESVSDSKKRDDRLQVLDEFIEKWDEPLVHHLLPPQKITQLLERLQKR